MRCACAAAAILTGLLVDCSRGAGSDSTSRSHVTASRAFTPWPSYLAKGYNKPGHPELTRKETLTIRRVLAVVRPCQRSFLRYAFPDLHPTDLPMVMFFEPRPSELFSSGVVEAPHVLGEGNVHYKPREGEAIATPDWESSDLRVDIKRLGCPPLETSIDH